MSEQFKKILRTKQAAEKLGVSLPTLWRKSQESGFPRKVKVGSRGVGFFDHELDAWLEDQKEGVI